MRRIVISVIILVALIGGAFFVFGPQGPHEDQAPVKATSNLIRVSTPQPNEQIQSPLAISGEARGNWFFEATFPVVLTNWDGLIIAESYATAKGEWMTTDFVPFTATLNFQKPIYGERGYLILKKDNPSGLPEHDDALEVPVRF